MGAGGVAGRSFSWTIVASLWLDVGRCGETVPPWLEPGRCDDSVPLRLSLVGDNGGNESAFEGAAKLLRLLAKELPLMRPDGSCALQRLDTLSERFIMALCTNPPSPLVGDVDRSGESRLGDNGVITGSSGIGSDC
jgi:hypothetical protein